MESEKKILIIEDSSTQALKLKLVLEEQGYSVILAKNGREGLDILRRVFCQIVITDWVMPEMNGVEFCRVLRATADLPGYVYVIL
ncbi:MAG: response regulator, partial [Deltaproteobacteria bacterium]|nr:response regulator [Deltaproteobacteria bacterium]